MKNCILFLYAIILTLFLSFNITAEVNVAEMVKNHPLQTDYPEDESAVLYEGIHYTLFPDGRICKKVHIVRTMFTENSLDRYGDVFIDYYEAKQDLKVEICRGYMLDGKQVDTYENGLNQITPDALARTTDYLGFQEMVVTHTGLEWGATSELLYTITDREPFQPWLEGIEYFQSQEYIILKEVKITVPERVNLEKEFLNGDENVKQEIKEGIKTWTWTAKNIPHILADDAYQHRLRFAPALIFSTCPDWKYAGNTFAREISNSVTTSELLKKAASEEIKDHNEEYYAIDELTKLVREKIHTVGYSTEIFKFYHRNAERVYRSLYGNPFDKAILLTALLKSQGLSAEIALSADNFPPSLSVPCLSLFDGIWVVTKKNGEELFIDPLQTLSGHSRKDLAGQALFRLNYEGNAPAILPAFSLEENKLVYTIKVKVKEDGAYQGSGYFRAGGDFNPYYEVVDNSEGATGWLADKMSHLLPGIKIKNGNGREMSDDGCKFTFEFEGDKLGEPEEGYISLKMPELPIGISDLLPSGLNLSNPQHENPVYLRGVGNLFLALTVELPEGWSVAKAPDSVNVNLPTGDLSLVTANKGQKMDLKLSISFKEGAVEPQDYANWRGIFQPNWNKNSVIVFKVK